MSYICACGKSFKYQQSLSEHGTGKKSKKGPCPAYMERKHNCLPVDMGEKKIKKSSQKDNKSITQQNYYDTNLANNINSLKIDDVRAQIKTTSFNDTQFFYLLIEREFIKTGESIYKIGRTIVVARRFMRYPKGSEIICVLKVPNCEQFETDIKVEFKRLFVNRLDIGDEYFEGDIRKMKNIIYMHEMAF